MKYLVIVASDDVPCAVPCGNETSIRDMLHSAVVRANELLELRSGDTFHVYDAGNCTDSSSALDWYNSLFGDALQKVRREKLLAMGMFLELNRRNRITREKIWSDPIQLFLVNR